MKKLVVLILLAGLAAVAAWQIHVRIAESREGAGRRRGPAAVAVELAPVGRADIRDVGVLTGSLQPKSQFVVAAKVSARLVRLHVNVGDAVRRDQLIAELDDEEYAQSVAEARAEIEVAKANVADCLSALEVAKREFDRAAALRDKKIASESELDAAEARHKASRAKHEMALAQVAQKEAALKAADIRLSYARVYASWQDGQEDRVVGERFVDEGALLRANEPIVSVLEDRRLLAVLHVIERDYPKVRVGQDVALGTDAYPGRQFAGRIVRIAPLLKETSRQGRVEVEVDNAERLLKSGMFVRARIEFAVHAGATVVPAGAVVTRAGQDGVFLAEGGKARFVPVTVGIEDVGLAEIVSPPLAGQVIVLGQHMLEDGGAIRLPEAAMRPGGPVRTPDEAPGAAQSRPAGRASRPEAAQGGRP